MVITDEVMAQIVDCIDLAPLHNPHNIQGIKACQRLLDHAPQVAVFDIAFHQTMPPYAYMYAIPHAVYTRHAVRRYGFHGTSHRYVAERTATVMKRPIDELKIVTCHLGNGCSMAAIDGGKSVVTSMGFTPLEGLVMGTRSGDIDPAVILHVMGREELTLHEANALLNKHSGLSGLSEVSGDMREVLTESDKGSERAELAVEVYAYRIRKYIGAYMAVLGGLDAVVFTAGVGENSPIVRAKACQGLERLGIEIDETANNSATGQEQVISPGGGSVEVWVVPTNEEMAIARQTEQLVAD